MNKWWMNEWMNECINIFDAQFRAYGEKNPWGIVTNFCIWVDIRDIITYATFGDDRLRGFGMAGVEFPISPLTCVGDLTTLSHNMRVCDDACTNHCSIHDISCYFWYLVQVSYCYWSKVLEPIQQHYQALWHFDTVMQLQLYYVADLTVKS